MSHQEIPRHFDMHQFMSTYKIQKCACRHFLFSAQVYVEIFFTCRHDFFSCQHIYLELSIVNILDEPLDIHFIHLTCSFFLWHAVFPIQHVSREELTCRISDMYLQYNVVVVAFVDWWHSSRTVLLCPWPRSQNELTVQLELRPLIFNGFVFKYWHWQSLILAWWASI